MKTRQRWLIITHDFDVTGDRSSRVVSQRIPWLQEMGIEPFVISGSTGARSHTFPHYQRAGWGPSGASEKLKNAMGTGNLLTRSVAAGAAGLVQPLVMLERFLFAESARVAWVIPAKMAGLVLTRNLPFDLVYSSGGPASAHLAAALIKARRGLPWFAELQFPLVARQDRPGESQMSYSRQERWLEALERRISREADLVGFTHPAAMEQARERTPELRSKSFLVLPGASPEQVVPAKHRYTNKLNLCHFGDIATGNSLAPLVRAIALLREAHPGVEANIQIRLFGRLRDPATLSALRTCRLESLLETQADVASVQRQAAISAADCLLLIQEPGPAGRASIPLQVYDFIATGRPILAITSHNQFLDQIVTNHAGYIAHSSRDDTIKAALVHLVADWHARRLSQGAPTGLTVEGGVKALLDHVRSPHFLNQDQTHLAPGAS
ncbi:MAG: glycosyltransferase [Pseudomonadota bacterium]